MHDAFCLGGHVRQSGFVIHTAKMPIPRIDANSTPGASAPRQKPVSPLEESVSGRSFAEIARRVESGMFARLFALHADPLRRYARRFVQSRAVAEDIVQEVFLRLWERWTEVEVGENIRAYLYTATRSRALDHLKREHREDVRRKRYVHPVWVNEGPALPPEGEEEDEIARALKQVLAQMPARQAEVVAIRLREGLSNAEIAERLGMTPRTVETYILRGAKLARELLPKILGDERSTP